MVTFADMILSDGVLETVSIAISAVGPALRFGLDACEQKCLVTRYLDFDFEFVPGASARHKLEKFSDIISVTDQVNFGDIVGRLQSEERPEERLQW